MKFLFGDKVKVIGGFYQGLKGVVTDYKCNFENGYDVYYFEGFIQQSEGLYIRELNVWLNENILEKVEEF